MLLGKRMTEILSQVMKEIALEVAQAHKSCTSWERGHLGKVNAPRGFPKHETKKKVGHSKEFVAH
jgi:hypothetical protein